MTKTKASQTIQEMCPKCGQHILACLCSSVELSAEWPASADGPRSEGEMSARLSTLKEAGSGTFFIDHGSLGSPATPPSIGLAPGAIIGGVYKIERLIGYGAMGEVYLATHLTLEKSCALKIIPPEQVTEIGWQRFQLEAKSVARLEHVNIVRVTDLGIHDGCLPFYAMEFLDGQNLSEKLVEFGPVPLKKALEIFLQVCDGVACAHRSGVLHRDLKPGNIMLTYTHAGKLEVKILDFGLAKLTKHDRFKQSITADGEVFGTPFYMSPEQGMGAEIDARSDIYSIGCTLFKTLTGKPPFSGESAFKTILRHQNEEPPSLQSMFKGEPFPQELEDIVKKTMAKRPEDRYQSMDQLYQDLSRLQEGKNLTLTSASAPTLCGTCRQPVADCLCVQVQELAQWPMSGESPRSEAEMSARFSIIKEEGSGTIFLTSSSAPGAEATTSIGLAPGAIVGGVYQIIRLIGRGTMGEVYLAKHLTLGKNCSLKVIPPDQVTEISWQRFQLEAKTVAKLNHVNIVRVTDLGIHDGCLPFYSMEYLDGKNLAEMLAKYGPMTLPKALEIFTQVCDGVECAHQRGILHRDLKPANIMLIQSPSGRVEVKILDFGLAKLIKDNRFKQSLTAVGDVFGSPSYMSPEQCGGDELDNRSDIYSIGCTLYECLTGRPPFHGQQAAAIFFGHLESDPPTLEHCAGEGKFPQAMEDIVAKLLRKDPDDRYQTMSELKADLEKVAADRNMPAAKAGNNKAAEREERNKQARSKPTKPTMMGHTKQTRSNKPMLLALGLVVLVGVGSCIFYEIYRSRQPNNEAAQTPVRQPDKVATAPDSQGVKPAAAVVVDTVEGSEARGDYDAEDKWDGEPFYRGKVMHDGKESQHWCYKTRRGPLVFLMFAVPQGFQKIGLVGDIYLPAEAQVSLSFRLGRSYPSNRLKALAGGNYEEINFGRYTFRDIEVLAPILVPCKTIKSLKLGDSDWSIEDSRDSVAVINQFPNIEKLSLSSKYEGPVLSKIHNIKELQELRLNRTQPYLHDCLKVISGSAKLTSFGASNWNLPASDLSLVIACPNLEKLMIGQLTGSHEQFVTFSKLPHLQELNMPTLHYRPDLAEDLRLLKSLKMLKVLMTTEWNNNYIAQLREDLPGVQVVPYVPPATSRRRSPPGVTKSVTKPGAD